MIHLSRFLIGIRHNRVFRFRSLAGQIVDNLIKELSDVFDRVTETSANDEFVLENNRGTLFATLNRDDIIIENRKIYDLETKKYVEVSKPKLLDITEKSLPIVSRTLSLKDDYMRVGMILEFRIPKWTAIEGDNFGKFICEKFISFPTTHERTQGAARFVYKIPVSGGGVIRNFKDFRNVIIRIDQDWGINEDGKKEKCFFISIDIQRIFDPFRKEVDIQDHFDFAHAHLTKIILPEFQTKGIILNYE